MSGPKRSRSNYPKEKLQNAIRAVAEGTLTSVKASEFYGVPQSTIRSHVNHPSLRLGAGRSSHLNVEEENHLVDLIKSLEKIGVRLTQTVLRKVIIEYFRLIKKDPRWKDD
jgi:transposase-like protein